MSDFNLSEEQLDNLANRIVEKIREIQEKMDSEFLVKAKAEAKDGDFTIFTLEDFIELQERHLAANEILPFDEIRAKHNEKELLKSELDFLKLRMEEAIEKEEYWEAAEIQKEIDVINIKLRGL